MYKSLKSLSSLFTVLSRKERKTVKPEVYLIQQFPVTSSPEEAATSDPARNTPWIGRFVIEDAEPQYFVFVEQKVLCTCPTLSRAVLTWFCCHYVFNLVYNKYCHDLALFFQEFIFGLPESGKKSSNYLAIATELNKCADTLSSA